MNRSLAVLGLVLLTGCSSKSNGASPADAGFVPLPASPTTFEMDFTVPPSNESFECTYVQMPATPGFIVAAEHEFTIGSHHLVIYKTSLTSIPAGESSPSLGDCYAPGATYMETIAGVVYASAVPTGSLTMPSGVGFPYSGSDIYLFQSHYLNASSTPIDAHVSVHLDVSPGPVQENAGMLFFYDPFIYVPQGATAIASERCPIPQDITLLTESSHYHARGTHYQAYLDPPGAAPATTPFYTSADWSSPTLSEVTMPISAGSFVRYYCDYDNTQGTQPYYQGQSAFSNEMCMFIGLYYPAMTTKVEQCRGGDSYGTGSVTCSATLQCLSKCPPASVGLTGNSGPVNVNSCYQTCFAQSCPNAAAPVKAALQCISTSCSTACATAGSACDTCVVSSCGTQYTACANATCGTVPPAP